MKHTSFRWLSLSLILILLLACNLVTTATPTATLTSIPEGPPTQTEITKPTVFATPTAAACQGQSTAQVTVYERPSTAADVFGIIGGGTSFNLRVRTGDDWYGFDPGVAQAANTGLFRYRWVQSGVGLDLIGDCEALPEVIGPAPGICYFMPMEDVPVYTEPSATSATVVNLAIDDYAAVTAIGDDWARLDLAQSNLELSGEGWVESSFLNLNGPCEALPTPEP